jgi:hypothetical protein
MVVPRRLTGKPTRVPLKVVAMAILILDAIGSSGEQLAIEAGKVTEIPVGYDSELNCATFDSDTLGEDELQRVIFDALPGIDPNWQTHLAPAE